MSCADAGRREYATAAEPPSSRGHAPKERRHCWNSLAAPQSSAGEPHHDTALERRKERLVRLRYLALGPVLLAGAFGAQQAIAQTTSDVSAAHQVNGGPAQITLSASRTSTDTRNPITFSGTVSPAGHVGELVDLQREVAPGQWDTIQSGRIDAASRFSISWHFVVAARAALRVLFPGDGRNTSAVSNTVLVTIQQAQKPDFTINSSRQLITDGQSERIFGVLSARGGANVSVTLTGRVFGSSQMRVLAHATTAANGRYSFTIRPTFTTEYGVRTTIGGRQRFTDNLFEGVSDRVSFDSSVTTIPVGKQFVVSGTVAPDKAGRQIDLEVIDSSGKSFTIRTTLHHSGNGTSAFRQTMVPRRVGSFTLLAHMLGDPKNEPGTSAPIKLRVT
jgi:hypothetical protein